MSEFKAGGDWFDRVNIAALSDDVRRRVLEKVKEKLGFTKTCEVLDIARSSLHRYLSGERRVPDEVVKKLWGT